MAEVVCDLEQRRAERLERLVGVQAPLLLLGLPLELARQRCQMLVERVLLLGELALLLTRLVALPRTGVGGDQSGHDARRGRDGGGLDGVSHAPHLARRHVPGQDPLGRRPAKRVCSASAPITTSEAASSGTAAYSGSRCRPVYITRDNCDYWGWLRAGR